MDRVKKITFSMSAQTIPDYPWKLFQMTALKLPGKLFLPPFGAWLYILGALLV